LPTPNGPTRKPNFWQNSSVKNAPVKEAKKVDPKSKLRETNIDIDMPKIGQLRVAPDTRFDRKFKRKCDYSGGCLFEKTSCNFTNSRTLSTNSQFRRVSGKYFDMYFKEGVV